MRLPLITRRRSSFHSSLATPPSRLLTSQLLPRNSSLATPPSRLLPRNSSLAFPVYSYRTLPTHIAAQPAGPPSLPSALEDNTRLLTPLSAAQRCPQK